MRRILLSLLTILPLGLAAQTDEQHFNALVISLTDGTTEYVSLHSEPCITYQDSLFVVTTTHGTKTFPRNAVKGYTFGTQENNGIANVSGPRAQQVEWKLVDRELRFTRLPNASTITLYTSDGQQVMTLRRSGHCTINLSRLASGVYVFDVNGKFYKIALS